MYGKVQWMATSERANLFSLALQISEMTKISFFFNLSGYLDSNFQNNSIIKNCNVHYGAKMFVFSMRKADWVFGFLISNFVFKNAGFPDIYMLLIFHLSKIIRLSQY